jgi:hypothetical protein
MPASGAKEASGIGYRRLCLCLRSLSKAAKLPSIAAAKSGEFRAMPACSVTA